MHKLPGARSCGDCDSCGKSGCGGKQRCRTWIAGVEATFLTTDIKGPASVVAISDDTITQQLTTRVDAGAVDNVYFAPRIWGGFQGPVWGVTGRYWKFQESESYVGDGGGGSFAALANSAEFNAYTVDLELTRLIERGCCSMIVAVGGRYAEVETSALATGSNDFNPGDPEGFASAFALSSNDFKGGGVTTGISGRRPIGRSKWNMFWNVRGSVLWGNAESYAAATALVNEASSASEAVSRNDTVSTSTSNAASGTGATNGNASANPVNDDRETLIIGEVQIGLECNKQFQCFPGTGFFRIAGEYQYWDIPGGSATAQAQASDAGAISLGIGQATDVEAQLYGMSVSAGLSY